MKPLRVLLLVVTLPAVLSSGALAQSIPSGQVPSEEAGRDKSGDEPYDIPELYGSRPFEGNESAKLPTLLAEYAIRAGDVYERISIFENGVAAIHIAGRERELQKRLIVSDESMKIYREQIAKLPLSELPSSQFALDRRNNARIRITRNGQVEEREFIPGTMLPLAVENFRLLLADLLEAITQDQQVTNPITTYTAQIGDRLISEDQKMYTVTRILQEGTIVEVELVGKSQKMYLPAELLPKLFIDVRSPRRQP
jgi:hypothetical protein